MAKRAKLREIEQIISIINKDERQDIVILIIPSHDKSNKPLKDQEIWAGNAMDLFADLYRGATAFQTFQGIYKDTEGKVYSGKPILIESYVERSRLADGAALQQLLDFAQRRSREAAKTAGSRFTKGGFLDITDFQAPPEGPVDA